MIRAVAKRAKTLGARHGPRGRRVRGRLRDASLRTTSIARSRTPRRPSTACSLARRRPIPQTRRCARASPISPHRKRLDGREAWSVIRKVTEPVGLDEQGRSMPRFQTWYGKDEIVPMFEHILLGQTEAERRAHTPPSAAVLEETFSWAAKRATTLASFSQERLAQRRAELESTGTASLGGVERVLMSPALVGHLLTHYDAMLRCLEQVPEGSAPPPSETNFAPCVGEEFPPTPPSSRRAGCRTPCPSLFKTPRQPRSRRL